METIYQAAALILFLMESILDLKQQKIWWPPCCLAGILGIIGHMFTGETILMLLLRLLPGIVLLFIAAATREGIGYGDGIMILTGGILQGWKVICGAFMIGLFFAAIWSGILLTIFRKGRKETIPFVPFLTAGLICEMVLKIS